MAQGQVAIASAAAAAGGQVPAPAQTTIVEHPLGLRVEEADLRKVWGFPTCAPARHLSSVIPVVVQGLPGRTILGVCAAGVVAALAITASASSRPAAGITVTAMAPTVALLQSDRSTGVHTYGVAASARWQPEAVHSEVRITIDDTSGASQVVNVRDQGNALHGSATYRGFFAVSGGTRHIVKASWLAYTPQASGRIEGKKTSPQIILEVPRPEPVRRLTDQQKAQLARDAKGKYYVCASLLAAGAVSALTGVGIVLTGALGVLAGAVCTQAYQEDQLSRDPVDLAFRSVAEPRTPAVPTILSGDGLSAEAAADLNAFVALQAREIGLSRAIYTAFNRSQGAHLKKQVAWEKKQMLAAGKYAGQLSALVLAELKLRPKVAAALASIEPLTFDQAYAFGDSVATGSLPTSVSALLAKLGASKAARDEIRAQVAVDDPSLYDGDLAGVLTNTLQTFSQREASAALKAFSKAAARNPLATAP